jgi:putative transcriptional regulator
MAKKTVKKMAKATKKTEPKSIKKPQKKSEIFDSMMEGLQDMQAYLAGDRGRVVVHHVHTPDADAIKLMRARFGMTQKHFAESFGFPIDCIKNWESGRRTPDTSAQLLLRVIECNPKAVIDALHM